MKKKVILGICLLSMILLSGCSIDELILVGSSLNVSGTDTFLLNVSDNPYTDWWLAFPGFIVKVNATRTEGLFINWSYILNAPLIVDYSGFINNLNLTKLNSSDQRYNDTDSINYVNLSVEGLITSNASMKSYADLLALNITGLQLSNDSVFALAYNLTYNKSGIGNCSGSTMVQNITVNGVQCMIPEDATHSNYTTLNVTSITRLIGDTFFDAGTMIYNITSNLLQGTFSISTTGNINTTGTINASKMWINNSEVLTREIGFSKLRYYRFNDFESTTAGFTNIWATTAIASGTAPLVAGNNSHPGIVTPTTSTTASSGHCWQITGATTYILDNDYFTNLVFRPISHTYGGINLSNATLGRFGFMDTFTASESVDGVYFNISQNTPFNNETFEVIGRATNNSIRTSTTTRYNLTNNTWYMLNIYIVNKSLAVFNVFNENNSLLWTDNISTTTQVYIPTAVGRETSQASCFWTVGNTTAQILAYDDFIDVGINRSTLR